MTEKLFTGTLNHNKNKKKLLSVPRRAGAFSRDFTTSLAPECRAFSGALKIEKLKAPLIPGLEGAVDTNDWCIINDTLLFYLCESKQGRTKGRYKTCSLDYPS